jgi:hypothetical protein
MEFAAHFLVAPPGFPLLSPISTTVYSFPNWVYLPFVVGLVAVCLVRSVKTRGLENGAWPEH